MMGVDPVGLSEAVFSHIPHLEHSKEEKLDHALVPNPRSIIKFLWKFVL